MSRNEKDYAPTYILALSLLMLAPLAVAWAMGWLR